MTFKEKSKNSSFQDRLTKRNEIDRQSLARELTKLAENEKRNGRNIDIAKQRFRSRCKKYGVGRIVSSDFKALDIQMYETHNPGFCYHRNGTIKENGRGAAYIPAIVEEGDSYEFVRAMLFANGEVSLEKLLCLHLLAAHTIGNEDPRLPVCEANFSSSSDGRIRPNGVWNDILPCYVIEIGNGPYLASSQQKLHHHSHEKTKVKEKSRDFELTTSYETRNSGTGPVKVHDRTLKKLTRKRAVMPMISGRDIAPRVTCMLNVDNFGKNDTRYSEDEIFFTNYVTDRAIRGAHVRAKSPSICTKIDRSLTMLKRRVSRGNLRYFKRLPTNAPRDHSSQDDLLTIKSSFPSLGNSGSMIIGEDATRSRNQLLASPSSTSSRNFVTYEAPRPSATIKLPQRVYLNSPVRSFVLNYRDCRRVDVLVNNQIRVLVQSVLRVLEHVSPDKMKWILETSGDRSKICDMFARPDIQIFVESLLQEPIVTSPSSYVVTRVIAVERIDARLEHLIGDELIAVSLELPASSALNLLLVEIRNNINGNANANELTSDVRKNRDESVIKVSRGQRLPPDVNCADPDRVILGRMTNSQRILVGKMCAAIKNRRINNEGKPSVMQTFDTNRRVV